MESFCAAELDYVEISVKQHPLDTDSLQDYVDRLLDNGLGICMHPYYNCFGFAKGQEHERLRPDMQAVLGIARETTQRQGWPVVLNFHAAYSSHTASRIEMLADSHAFHNWLMDTVDTLNADVIITTEHQLPAKNLKGRVRIGDNFNELLMMIERVTHSKFGICWDMGHSVMGTVRHERDIAPPEGFCESVKHVHIHDVSFEQVEDHRPIGTADSPLQDYLTRLMAAGYEGNFTMEYNPNEFFDESYTGFLQNSKANFLALLPT